MDTNTLAPHFFRLGRHALPAVLRMPTSPTGLIVFAHGSGSGHLSPRNNQVAEAMSESGFATLLFDLLTMDEESNRQNVFDIALLASRLVDTIAWAEMEPVLGSLPVGLFGASTGAGAALVAAAHMPDRVLAVVSRGGRPDLAGPGPLGMVRSPTMLIVGAADHHVIELNRAAAQLLRCEKEIVIVPGAGHLFEEPGALADVVRHSLRWFSRHLARKAR